MKDEEDFFDLEFNDLLAEFLNTPPPLFNPPVSRELPPTEYSPSLPDEAYCPALPTAASQDVHVVPRSNMWAENIDCSQFSRKIFIGRVPHFATQRSVFGQALEHIFHRFGSVEIEWPRPATHPSSNQSAPRLSGYLFLVYKSTEGVRQLIRRCDRDDDGEFHLHVGAALENVTLHVRLWRLEDADYCFDPSLSLIPTMNTVFLGRLPRMATAGAIAQIMEEKFGHVIYVQIDVDMKNKYPQGCAAVFFSSPSSYLRALKEKIIDLGQIANRNWATEIKPFVCFGEICDECGKEAGTQFCNHIYCLQYYCGNCWNKMHNQPRMAAHLPYKENKRRNLDGPNASVGGYKKTSAPKKFF